MSVALLPLPAQKAPLGRSPGFTSGGAPALPPSPAPSNHPKAPAKSSKASGLGGFINDAIDTEQRVQRAIQQGAAPGAARGRQYGATVGGILGGAGGQALGAYAGKQLIGAAAPTANPVLIGAATVGTVVLVQTGEVVGTQTGQALGGMLGEAVGGLFDEPRPTSRPVRVTNDPLPFTGGQCEGELYFVDYFTEYTYAPGTANQRQIVANSTTSVFGPVRGWKQVTNANGSLSIGVEAGTPATFAPLLTTNPAANPFGGITGVRPRGSFDDNCGDPLPDPDYYTPRTPPPRVTRDNPVGFPTRPRLPGGREPTPGVPGEDEPIEPYSPRLPGKPENPGPPDNPTQPGPDGAPGSDDPAPERPKPPAPPEDCDPCAKIDQLTELVIEAFEPSTSVSVPFVDCPTGEVDPDTGEPVPPEVTPLSADGAGFVGVFQLLESILEGVRLTFNKVPCPEEETAEDDFPVIIYPSDIYTEFNLESRLLLELTPVDDFPKRTNTSSKWSIEIPNPRADLNWCDDFEDFRFFKGPWYGRAIWSSSGIRSGTYCKDEDEARRVVGLLMGLTEASPKRIRVTDSGREGMYSEEVRVIRAVRSTIENGVVTSCVQYVPTNC